MFSHFVKEDYFRYVTNCTALFIYFSLFLFYEREKKRNCTFRGILELIVKEIYINLSIVVNKDTYYFFLSQFTKTKGKR